MTASSGVAAIPASVLHLRIADFTRLPVSEQAGLKSALSALLQKALAGVPAADRVVLDAAHGFAVVILSSPATALAVGRRVQQGAAGRAFCVGINHGPVQWTGESDDNPTVAGDGLNTAATIAIFVPPGGLLATDAFRRALGKADPRMARALLRAGSFNDANIRAHELFSLDPDADGRSRRRWFAVTGAGVIALLLAGVAAREVKLQVIASRQPAVLVLNVEPDGQLFVNGLDMGSTPPLKEVPVKAGRHQVEVRKEGSPPLRLDVNLGPGERLAVNHTFVIVPKKADPPKPATPRKPRKQEQPGFFDEVKRFFGFK